MATSLDKFMGLVAGRIARCPDVLLREALREACIEFCRRTRLLAVSDALDVEAGEARVDLYPPEGTVYIVDQVLRDTTPLERLSRHDFDSAALDVQSGLPSAYYVDGDRALVLGPVPIADETLTARFIVRPTDSATSVDDVLYRDWREGIAAGARAYLRRHHEAWVDPTEEGVDRELFERAMSRANLDRAQGGSRRKLTVRGHYF